MTTHNWDESPLGTWSLEVHNDGRYTGESAPCPPGDVVIHSRAAHTSTTASVVAETIDGGLIADSQRRTS